MFIILLISQLGLKDENFQLYNSRPGIFLFSELEGGDYSLPPNRDRSWIFTEPLGGIMGGMLGCCCLPMFGGEGVFTGYFLGVSAGIWAMGRYVEEERGNFFFTLIGSIIPGIPALLIEILDKSHSLVVPEFCLIAFGPTITGTIFYRMSLPKEE